MAKATRRPVKVESTETEEIEEVEDEKGPDPEAEEVVDEMEEQGEGGDDDDDDDDDVDPYEGMDDDDELWEGGPTLGMLKGWKAEHGENDIYLSIINPDTDEYCIWRSLNRYEYKRIVKKVQEMVEAGEASESDISMINEELITETCVLHPPYDRHSPAKVKAGFPKLIANEVMEQSGFAQVMVRRL